MRFLLACARIIDIVNTFVGRAVAWLVLAAVVISAGNAIARYALKASSNAWLEIQWYLFAAIFLLSAGYALLKSARVRIDIVSARLSDRPRASVDIVGSSLLVVALTPVMLYC